MLHTETLPGMCRRRMEIFLRSLYGSPHRGRRLCREDSLCIFPPRFVDSRSNKGRFPDMHRYISSVHRQRRERSSPRQANWNGYEFLTVWVRWRLRERGSKSSHRFCIRCKGKEPLLSYRFGNLMRLLRRPAIAGLLAPTNE
jgi:hypothetical protein